MNERFRILRMADAGGTGGAAGGGGGGAPRGRVRPGSVSLRAGAANTAPSDHELLDPANQSLADALRITLRLIQGGMLILGGLFLVSGSQSVRETERGVRLMFGKVVNRDVEPGLSINPPYPVGELVRVDVGLAELKVDEQFWIFAANKADLARPLDQQPKQSSLTPGQGGSNLTADGNLAHTQWKVIYAREDHKLWAENVLPDSERDLVRTAAQRGIVQACAKTNLDDLLRQNGSDVGSVASRAKSIAQAQLDRVRSGIRVQALLLENVTPPMLVREKFNSVQGTVSAATKTIADAESAAATRLTEQTGASNDGLRKLLDEYENAIEGRGTRKPDDILANINSLMAGEPVTIGDVRTPGIASGRVAQTIAEAKQYQSEISTRLRGQYERYKQKEAQFRTNPRLVIASEVAESVRVFMAKPDLQITLAPPGTGLFRISVNPDPDVLRDILTRRRQAEAESTRTERLKTLFNEQYRPKDITQGEH